VLLSFAADAGAPRPSRWAAVRAWT